MYERSLLLPAKFRLKCGTMTDYLFEVGSALHKTVQPLDSNMSRSGRRLQASYATTQDRSQIRRTAEAGKLEDHSPPTNQLTLAQKNIELEKEAFKEDGSLQRIPFSGSMFVWQSVEQKTTSINHPIPTFQLLGAHCRRTLIET